MMFIKETSNTNKKRTCLGLQVRPLALTRLLLFQSVIWLPIYAQASCNLLFWNVTIHFYELHFKTCAFQLLQGVYGPYSPCSVGCTTTFVSHVAAALARQIAIINETIDNRDTRYSDQTLLYIAIIH